MKKQIVTMLCGAVAVALAVPAFSATATLSGQIRTQLVLDNVTVMKKTPGTYRKFVSERLSPKLTVAVNDMVSVVYAGEIDLDWGTNDPRTVGFDGAQSGDGMNLETKDLYTTVKLGGDYNLSFVAGLQPVGDGIENLYFRDDVAGLTVAGKAGMVDLNAGWLKISEIEGTIGNAPGAVQGTTAPATGNYAANDDIDLYFLKAGFVPAEGSKAGVELWMYRDMGPTATSDNNITINTLALNGSTKVAGFGLSGFLAMQTGERGDLAGDPKISAFAASALLSQKFNDTLSGNLRLIYMSADTDKTDVNAWHNQYIGTKFVGGGANLAFLSANQPIFLTNGYKTSFGGFRDNLIALNPGTKGSLVPYGLIAGIVNVDYVQPAYYFKGAVGYYMTATDKINSSAASKLEGTNLGLELFGQVGTKIADAANVYARVGYAALGSAYDKQTVDTAEPFNPYFVSLGMDVPF